MIPEVDIVATKNAAVMLIIERIISLACTISSHNDTAEVGLATVRALAPFPVLDSMIHHLLDRLSVGDGGVVRGLLLVALLEGALGVEVLSGALGEVVDAEAALGSQVLVTSRLLANQIQYRQKFRISSCSARGNTKKWERLLTRIS